VHLVQIAKPEKVATKDFDGGGSVAVDGFDSGHVEGSGAGRLKHLAVVAEQVLLDLEHSASNHVDN
jgi:hypothetical protein